MNSVTRILLSAFMTFCPVSLVSQVGQATEPITRVYNASGWEIPGMKNIRPKPGTVQHSPYAANGASYQVSVFIPKDTSAVRVPFVWLDSSRRRFVYEDKNVWLREIRAYEVNKRPYCYKVSLVLSPKSVFEEYATTLDVWYYDEGGNGKWTVMDTNGPLLPNVPMPPKWAEQRGF